MRSRSCLGWLFGVSVVCATSLSWAQCTKDTDCKGDRVCEEGACVSPAAAAPAAAPAGTSEAAPTSTPPAPTPVPPAAQQPPSDSASPYQPPYATDQPYGTVQPAGDAPSGKPRRHSTGMMVGGIVMVSLVPIAILAALVANAQQDVCENGGYYYDGTTGSSFNDYSDCGAYDKTIYGGTIGAVVLLGAGIPMIVVGGKRERPGAEARVTPWASPQGAGLKLRLDL